MDKNEKERAYELAAAEIMTRQIEVTSHMLEYFYNLLIQYRSNGQNVIQAAYMVDLLCGYLMRMYGGDNETINTIQAEAKKELMNFKAEQKKVVVPPTMADELKNLGINFKIVYDPKTKKTYPNIDIDKLNIPQNVIDDWMRTHMDEILDEYLKRQKKLKDEKKTDKK